MKKEENRVLVGGYIRVSTTDQALRGLSLEAQEEAIREECERKGWELTELYIDRGISAKKKLERRKAFMRMIEDVRLGRINRIVIVRLDRFFRNTYDYHRMMKEYLEPAGCEWSAVSEDYETATTNGRMMINVRLAVSEQECDMTSDRIRDVFRGRIKSGHWVTGTCARGLRITEDKRLVWSDEAHFVREAFELVAQNCNESLTRRIMRERGFEMNQRSFGSMLRKEIYIGRYRDIDNFVEPIVSKELFYHVQTIISNRKWNDPEFKTSKDPFLFSGLIRCPECGNLLTGNRNYDKRSTYRYKYYRCMKHWADRRCPNNHYLSEQKVEDFIVSRIAVEWDRYQIEMAQVKETRKKERASMRSLSAVKTSLARVNELYIEGKIEKDEYTRRVSALEEERQKIEDYTSEDAEAIEPILDNIDFSNFKEAYAKIPRDMINGFWRACLSEIVIDSNLEPVGFSFRNSISSCIDQMVGVLKYKK